MVIGVKRNRVSSLKIVAPHEECFCLGVAAVALGEGGGVGTRVGTIYSLAVRRRRREHHLLHYRVHATADSYIHTKLSSTR